MGAKERIKEFCKAQGIRISAFEKRIGATNGYVNSISRWVGPEYEKAILEYFPNLNIEWAKTGEGTMLVGEPSGETRAGRVRNIPLLPFSAVAGWMTDNNGVDSFRGESVMFSDFSDRGADCAIRVDGDSMWPRYSSGDILAIRIVEPTFFQWGRVYCLSTTQGCVVKRLFPDKENPDNIICHSENSENYPDYSIPKSEVISVAIVVGHAGVE